MASLPAGGGTYNSERTDPPDDERTAVPSSIWTGAISFGLVQVPVRLVTATKNRDVSFNQLEEGTNARIRYKKVSDQTGDEVPADKIVKGYEISKGRYVVVEADEIAALQPKAAHTIEIEEFIDLDQIDPIYFEQPYYLAPDAKGIKPYQLLVDAMTDLNKVAIGRVVLRSKERLVAIRPLDGVLCIETMRYADEVMPREALQPDEDVELSERERTMARQLVESLAADKFDPDKYHDEYREQLLDLIERKASGEEIVAPPAAEAPAKVLDLVSALEASLAKASSAKERHPSVAGVRDADVTDEEGSDAADEAPKRARATKATAKKAAKAAKPTAKKSTRSRRSA
jgi:DNA end-binding protein Ku